MDIDNPAGPYDEGNWRQHAACAGMDTNEFFPEKNKSIVPLRELCAVCPVREACLEYALVNVIQHGVWGGMSERQRRSLRRQRRMTV